MRIFSLEGKLAGALVAWSTLTALSVVVARPVAGLGADGCADRGARVCSCLACCSARRLASPVARLIRALVRQRVGVRRRRFQFFDPQHAPR